MAAWKPAWAKKKDAEAELEERFEGLDTAGLLAAISERRSELREANSSLPDIGGHRAATAAELEWLEQRYETVAGQSAP